MTIVPGDAFGLLLGAVALGAVYGVEPGHGWPVAASYALDQTHKWLYGFVANFILGVGHRISSLTMVGVFFYAKSYFSLTQINEPVTVLTGIQSGGPVSLVAGVLLIGLGSESTATTPRMTVPIATTLTRTRVTTTSRRTTPYTATATGIFTTIRIHRPTRDLLLG